MVKMVLLFHMGRRYFLLDDRQPDAARSNIRSVRRVDELLEKVPMIGVIFMCTYFRAKILAGVTASPPPWCQYCMQAIVGTMILQVFAMFFWKARVTEKAED